MRKFWRLLRIPRSHRYRVATRLAAELLRDDKGGEVIEYALVLGLVVVVAIGVITCVGTKVVARWTTIKSAM